MAKGKTKHPLSIVVSAIDKATAPMRSIRKRIDEVMAPAKRLRGALRLEYKASGIPRFLGGFKQLKGSLFASVRALSSLLTKFALVGGAAAGAAFALVRSWSQANAELARASLRLGVSADRLERWRFAAKRSGIEAEEFDDMLQELSVRMAESAAGTGEGIEAFEALGIEFFDTAGRLRTIEDILPEVADKLSSVENASARLAIASGLLGDEGMRMVQMLDGGSEGLAKMEARAKALGIGLDKGATDSGLRFTAAMVDLSAVMRVLRNTIATQLAPTLTRWFESLTQHIADNRARVQKFVRGFMDSLPERLAVLRASLAELWASIKPVLARIAELWEWFMKSENQATAVGVALAGLIAILLGPALVAIGGVVAALGTLAAAMLTTPVGWLMAAIAAMVAGIVWLGDNWDWLGDKIDSVVAWIKGKLTGLRDWAAGIFEDIGSWITGIFGGGGKLEVSVEGTERLRDDVRRGRPGGDAPDPDAILNGRSAGAAPPAMPSEVRVRFDNVPPGVNVEQERRGDAPLTVDVGHALPEVAM